MILSTQCPKNEKKNRPKAVVGKDQAIRFVVAAGSIRACRRYIRRPIWLPDV